MRLPPTISRELRATARRSSTYWGRAVLATFAVLSCLFVFDLQSLAMSPARVGRILFTLIASIGACFAALASLFTADSISSERRQGTLGLLFLTDQTAVDVILGKLAVHGFASLYLLLGLMPALMLSLLAGGITYSEVLRTTLVLLNLLLLSLSVGIFVSVQSWGQFASILKSVSLLAGICLGPLVMARFVASDIVPTLSPLHGILSAYGNSSLRSPLGYWISEGLTLLLACALLLAASVSLHLNWRSTHQPLALKPKAVGSRRLLGPARAVLIGRSLGRRRFAPVARALLRMRGQRPLAWLAAVNCFVASLAMVAAVRGLGSIGAATSVSLIFGLTGQVLFAMVGGRFLIDARQSGELELLLVTPVGARGLVREMRMAVIRIILGPLYLVAAGGLIAGAAAFSLDPDRPLGGLCFSLAHLANAVLQVLAVARVSMSLAGRNQNIFTLAGVTVGLVVVIPSVAWAGMNLATQAIGLDQLWSSAAGLFGIGVNVGFLRWAGVRLRRDFRAHDRSRFDRFFDWCDGWISGNLNRT